MREDEPDNDVKVSSLRVEMSLSHMYPVHIYHIVFFLIDIDPSKMPGFPTDT